MTAAELSEDEDDTDEDELDDGVAFTTCVTPEEVLVRYTESPPYTAVRE